MSNGLDIQVDCGGATGGTTVTGVCAPVVVPASTTIVDDISTNATRYILFDNVTSGSLTTVNTSSTKLTFNPSTGDFTAGGNVTAYSDAQLKSDVRTIEDALEVVRALRGVRFVKEGRPGIGVIAQEVEQHVPEVVIEGEYKSVAYGNLVGLLIEAVKALDAKVAALEKG